MCSPSGWDSYKQGKAAKNPQKQTILLVMRTMPEISAKKYGKYGKYKTEFINDSDSCPAAEPPHNSHASLKHQIFIGYLHWARCGEDRCCWTWEMKIHHCRVGTQLTRLKEYLNPIHTSINCYEEFQRHPSAFETVGELKTCAALYCGKVVNGDEKMRLRYLCFILDDIRSVVWCSWWAESLSACSTSVTQRPL